MSVSKAAKLILTLVDQVSGPAQAITAALTGVNTAVGLAGKAAMAPVNAVGNAAREFRRSAGDITVAGGAIAMGLGKAGKTIYDMEDTLNEIVGRRFGKNEIFNLADGTEMTKQAFRKDVTELISEINKTSPRHAGEIAKAYNQLVQAGLSHEQVEGVLPISIDFAIAGNYDTEQAADTLTNVMTAMRLPMATLDEAHASALRAADVISYAATETNSSVEQMTEAFKYAAPSASALGISIEQLAAMFLIQAKRGIKASEAGVSIRAMMTRMIRPTNMAQEALGRYNIDLADYLEKSKEISAGDISNALAFNGLDAKAAEAEVQKILDSTVTTGEKVKTITAEIMKAVGDNSTMSAEQISASVSDILFGFGESLDVERLIADMQAANIAMSDFFRIFDVRQGARTLALFGDDFSKWTDELEMNSAGFAEALRLERMGGIVGAVSRMSAAMVDLFRAAADSGVLDTVTRAVENFAAAINKLVQVNPLILELGTYGLAAVAGLAAFGFAMTGVSAAASLMVNPITAVAAAVGYLAYLNWDQITGYVRGFGAGVREGMGPETTALIDRASSAIGGLFQRFEGDAAGLGASHGAGLMRGIETTIVRTREMIASLKEIAAAVQANPEFQATVDLLASFFNTMASAGAAAWRVIKGVASGVKEFAVAFAENLAPGSVAGMRDGIVSLLNAFTEVNNFVGGVFDKIYVNFDESAARAGAAAARMVNYLTGIDWSGHIQRSIDLLKTLPGVVSALAADLQAQAAAFYAAGVSMVQSLWDGATAKFAEFIEWVRGLPGRIREAFGNLNLSTAIGFTATGNAGNAGGAAAAGAALGSMVGKPKPDGARASGGPVKAGLTYKVGENGIELFTPAVNGSITPNHKLGGGAPSVVINNRFVVQGGQAEQQAAEIFRQLERQLNRSAQIIFGSGNAYGEA